MKRFVPWILCIIACGGGGTGDSGFDSTNPLDLDGDGVCDNTEAQRGLDPSNPDTDRDGFSDSIELRLGFDPLLPASPNRDDFWILAEEANTKLDVAVNQAVRGDGADYVGAFEGRPFRSEDGLETSDFYLASKAIFGDPSENISSIDEDAEAFRGVAGETLLGFEVSFIFTEQTALGCARIHPWAYNIKRNDGRLVQAKRQYLVVAPKGMLLSNIEWCPPTDSQCF